MNNSSERRKINGEWVRTLRKGLGLSQEELAEALGVSRPSIARWEANAFRPTKLAAMALLNFAAANRVDQGMSGQKDGAPTTLPVVHHESRSKPRGRTTDANRRSTPQRKPD